MKQPILFLGMVLISASMMVAEGPIGSVTSAQSFLLRGHGVPVAGVPNWAVMAGDEIGTTSSPAIIRFQDGSRVILSENSKSKIEQINNTTVFRLQSGSAILNRSQDSRTVFLVENSQVATKAGVDTSVSSSKGRTPSATEVNVPVQQASFRVGPVRPLSGR